jgi:hypothetical protein
MLLTSFFVLLAAAMLGIVLGAVHLGAGRAVSIPWPAWGLHGVLGVAGFAALVLGLRGPPRGVAMGVSGFGRFAAVALVAALLLGAVILSGRLRRRPISVLTLGLHATLAIGGVVVLAAYVAIR